MVKDTNHPPNSVNGNNAAPTDFPSRLAELIGDSSVRGFARKAGVSDTFLRQCLAGRTEPTRTKLIALATAGDSTVEWLATGGGTRRGGSPGVAAAPLALDRERLQSVVAAVERALSELGQVVTADRKALLIIALYQLQSEQRSLPTAPEDILKLVADSP